MSSSSAADRAKWEELYASGGRPDRPPSRWVLDTVARTPNDRPVADIAGGTGRHAVPIARTGRRVVLVDAVFQAVTAARKTEPELEAIVADASSLPLLPAQFGVVLVTNFLDRSIFGDLIRLLVPGGYLVYETYTRPHLDLVNRGLARGPHSPNYVLEPGELPHLARPLTVVEHWEGEVDDDAGRRCCARLLARQSGQRPEARSQR
jgi:SAM-dependent methyltransferase